MDELDHLLSKVKQQARGWMPLCVYRRIYESAAASAGGTIVEIGTFCGAATIALALGARAAGTFHQIITADLHQPTPGEPSNAEERIERLHARFEAFGVASSISCVHGTSADLVRRKDPTEIRLLLLDGGGRIEQDFANLYGRMNSDCVIIIDDIDGRTFVRRNWHTAVVDQKHRISYLLAERFVAAGLILRCSSCMSTGWFRRGSAVIEPTAIELLALPAYHELIKVSVHREEFGLSRVLSRWFAARAPWLARTYRRLRPVGECP